MANGRSIMKFADVIGESPSISLLVAILLLSLACTAPAYSATKANAAQERKSPGKTEKNDVAATDDASSLVVINNIAVVRFSPSAWDRLPLFGGYTSNEAVFVIRPIKEDVSSAVVTSSGLGNAVFIRESALNADTQGRLARLQAAFLNIRGCPEPSWAGASSLPLSDLKAGEDVKVRIRFPCDLVSDPGDTLEGKILVIVPQQKLLEAPIKIQNPAASPFYTALLWFLGLMIPTLLSYQIYKLQNQVSEQRVQWAAFQKYIYDNRTTLADFFDVYYKEISPDKDPEFAKKLAQEFAIRKIIENIPVRERRKIEDAITRCNRSAIRKALTKAFPSWKKQIGGG
jgi:hypothetical protein